MNIISNHHKTKQHAKAQKLRSRVMFFGLLTGAGIAFILLFTLFSGKETDFDDAATFGAQTTSIFAEVGDYPIHCHSPNREALSSCLAGAISRKAEDSALWLGNSQVHAVNQLQQGETNSVPILFDAIRHKGMDLLTFSQPNANLQEHYVLFEYLRLQLHLRVLILPVVFDDLREEGLRDEIAYYARDESTASALLMNEVGRRLVSAAEEIPADQDTAGISQTMQERVERVLNTWLDKHSSLWRSRPEIRGQLIYGVLYQFRNWLFGIKASTKRKMIPGRYRENMAALVAILSQAKQNKISVVLYIAPFRGGVENPYVDEDYARFKSEVAAMAESFDVVYANLESLVPEKLWGYKDSTAMDGDVELDFMHFQAGGHKLLARRLEVLVNEALDSRNYEQ